VPYHTYLTGGSILFWLTALIGAGIIIIGVRFILAPRSAAVGFGVPALQNEAFTYLWTKGTRDIVSGLLVIGMLSLRVDIEVLAVFLLISSLIPVGDFLNVYAHLKTRNVPALLIHGGTAVFMWVLGVLMLRR